MRLAALFRHVPDDTFEGYEIKRPDFLIEEDEDPLGQDRSPL